MLEWVARPTLRELTAEFSQRLRQRTGGVEGAFPLALTGGGSAAVFYDALLEAGVPEAVEFYWSDERVVPPTSPDSNFKLADDHLLRPAGVASQRVHAVPTALPPVECAAAYATEVRTNVAAGPGGTPRFPLIILGLGEDGHTGSLFPGRNPYQDQDRLVRAVEGTEAHPHPRVTFTPQLINAAAAVWFVVTGTKKNWALQQLRERTAPPVQVPSLTVDPNLTEVVIFHG